MQSIYEIADIRKLTTENSKIVPEGDFPVLFLLEENGERRLGPIEVKRAFPFEKPEEFIVLTDSEGKDQGFIRALSERREEEQILLRKELARRYFMPQIKKIFKITDRFNFSYWKTDTDKGTLEFSVRDTNRSIVHLGKRLIITDADGNRYEIPDIDKLQSTDRKKIEIYLW